MNATKFVVKGFIRLRAEVVDGSVVIYAEDSGPGVPSKTKETLFRAFEEKLDFMQGTGFGFFVCYYLSSFMGITISVDKDYSSGVEGYPGTRFVIDLNKPIAFDAHGSGRTETSSSNDSNPNGSTYTATLACCDPSSTNGDRDVQNLLNASLSVLFVDDDVVLRKLCMRTVRKVAPAWTLHEACSGESALHLIDDAKFDIIFMDQYMPGIEIPLLGTETVRLMRLKGVAAIICGLSANDTEAAFIEAGADAFMLKPFPCQKAPLIHELSRIITSAQKERAIKAP